MSAVWLCLWRVGETLVFHWLQAYALDLTKVRQRCKANRLKGQSGRDLDKHSYDQ